MYQVTTGPQDLKIFAEIKNKKKELILHFKSSKYIHVNKMCMSLKLLTNIDKDQKHSE